MLLIVLLLVQKIDVNVYDTPNDDGSSITVSWTSDTAYQFFKILRGKYPEGEFEKIGETQASKTTYVDTQVQSGVEYFYKIVAKGTREEVLSGTVGPAKAVAQIFNTGRTNIAVCIVILFFAIIYYIARARRGEKLYVRRIPGITAIEEAIGRATEMGKPVLYVPGIMDIDEPETIASMSILARVAEKTAEYNTTLYVPTSKAMVMSMAQQVVKESATKVGRPDWLPTMSDT